MHRAHVVTSLRSLCADSRASAHTPAPHPASWPPCPPSSLVLLLALRGPPARGGGVALAAAGRGHHAVPPRGRPVRARASTAGSTSPRRRARRVRSACAGRVRFAGRLPGRGRVVSVVCGAARRDLPRARRRPPSAAATRWRPASAIGTVAASHLQLGARRTGAPDGYVDPLTLLATRARRRSARRRARRPRAAPTAAPVRARAPAPRRRRREARERRQRVPLAAWLGLGLLVAGTPLGALLAVAAGAVVARRRGRRRRTAAPAAGAGGAVPIASADHGVLRHHADLLRQRGARISGTRTRRSRPTSSPGTCGAAGGGRLLPHRAPTSTASRSRRPPSARASRRSELADRNAERFKALHARRSTRRNDFFIRTSDPEHEAKVQEVLQRVHDNGYVYKGLYEGWYCPRCADFKSETEQGPDHTCPIHEIPLTREQEENYFFALSTFQQQLEELLADRLRPARTRAPTRRGRSSPRASRTSSLTRGKLTWGVRVPWDESHVFYVWFDALLNYYTALSYARARRGPRPTASGARRRRTSSARTSSSSTRSTGRRCSWPRGSRCPSRVFIHGFLLGHDGRKMSKSLGNVLDPFEVIERFGTDALRYYLMRDVAFGEDGSVSMEGVERRYETELANDLGNLASRTIEMVQRYRDGAVPEVAPTDGRRSTASRRRSPRRWTSGASPTRSRRLAARPPAQRVRRGAGAVEAREGRGQRGRARPRARHARRRACAASPSCSSRSCPRRWAALDARAVEGDARRARSSRCSPSAKSSRA